jgi:hypothetical protein
MTRNHWLIGAAVAAAIGGTLYFSGYAKAADLGGSCCADLEERIAELEATTARKGNRKVSLEISGNVTHSIMAWDDGKNSDMYIGDGGGSSSRFRLKGAARISPNLTAGFVYEFGVYNNLLGSMNQGAGGDDLGGAFLLRDSTVYLEHKGLGKVQIGHGSTATDNLILIDLGNVVGTVASPDIGVYNGSFNVLSGGSMTPLVWNQGANGGVSFDTARRNHVLYETPSLAGFTAQIAAGENSFWDVALRYANEVGGFRIAGGLGYSVDEESPMILAGGSFGGFPAVKLTDTKGSASVLHLNTGLFLTAAGGMRETDLGVAWATAKDSHFWHVIGGVKRNWSGLGATSVYAEYHEAKDMLGFTAGPFSTSSTVNMLGFGIVQSIDSASMDLFLAYKQYSGDAKFSAGGGGFGASANDFSAVIGGARISF